MQSGKKLAKKLNVQRSYLRSSFDSEPNEVAKSEYIHAISQLADFLRGPWKNPRSLTQTGSELEQTAAFALLVLSEAKHTIVVPLLARYYGAYRVAASDERESRYNEFLDACRACLGFFGLWRGARRGTAGIDKVHRSIMAGTEIAAPFCRGLNGRVAEIPATSQLKKILNAELDQQSLGTKEEWVKSAARLPVAKQQLVARLVLLAASQDTVPDPDENGLTVRGRRGLLGTLSSIRWEDSSLKTVEHTAPKTPTTSGGWNADLYDDPDFIHTLGNLTLLPANANASAGNRSWEAKKVFYAALSAPTIEDAESLLRTASEAGLNLGMGATEIVQSAPFLPLVAAVARYDGSWDAEFVQKRGERIAELAYESFAEWLK